MQRVSSSHLQGHLLLSENQNEVYPEKRSRVRRACGIREQRALQGTQGSRGALVTESTGQSRVLQRAFGILSVASMREPHQFTHRARQPAAPGSVSSAAITSSGAPAMSVDDDHFRWAFT